MKTEATEKSASPLELFYRAVKTWLWARIAVVVAVVAAAPLVTDLNAVLVFAGATVLVIAALVYEIASGQASVVPRGSLPRRPNPRPVVVCAHNPRYVKLSHDERVTPSPR